MLKRGSVYLAKLYPSKGHEHGKTRPVLVLQTDLLTEAGHTTVIIVPLTTQLSQKAYPLRFRVSKRSELLKDSELLCDQLRAIDINRIIPEELATLSTNEMLEVEQYVQIILDISN